jgi:predicted nicotinamide N-methyase
MSKPQMKSETIAINQIDYLISSLKDNQQFDEQDTAASALGISSATWPLFGVVWPTSIVMALQVYSRALQGKRVLEIGCGIGLCSIVLHRMGVDITASDYHPRTREFLDRNIRDNGLSPIKYQTGNWETENPLLGRFDVIIGSDILYQPDHVQQVSGFIDRHTNDDVQVMIGDPGRRNRAGFTRGMIALGFSHRSEKFDMELADSSRCKGHILHFKRKTEPSDHSAAST